MEAFGFGRFEARVRVPHAPSSITGFFLYEPPDEAQEIDIEIFNDRTGRVMFTYYSAGHQVSRTHELPFDPTAGFHTYGFTMEPRGWSSPSTVNVWSTSAVRCLPDHFVCISTPGFPRGWRVSAVRRTITSQWTTSG